MGISQITIIEPQSLIKTLTTPYIFGSTATFGTPYYGSRLLGKVQYFDTQGCNEEDYELEKSSVPIIVAVWREGCTFVKKTEVAEKKGGKAILIIDSKNSKTSYIDIRRVIMSKGEATEEVEIPALLIGEIEGEAIIQENEEVIIELSWSMPKLPWTELDLWMSPALSDSLKFLEEFYPYALALREKLDFYPHYWVISLNRNYSDKCWDKDGHFCSLNAEWDNKVTGREILEETVRQICLYETTYKSNNTQFFSEQWWNYVAEFRKKCVIPNEQGKNVFGENCSYDLMARIGVKIKPVKDCYNERAVSILSNERLTEAWSPMAALINGWHFSGSLDAETVAKAICTGFKDLPEECVEILNKTQNITQTPVSESNGIGPLSIVFISFFASAFALLVIFLAVWRFIYPKFRNNMRYTVMKEVHNEIQKQKTGLANFENRGIGNSSQYTIYP